MSVESFGFPFTPYSVQLEFMERLKDVLEKGQVGIFESPTGTGKSMSLLCGSLSWLKEHQKNIRRSLEEKASFEPVKSISDDWLSEQLECKSQQDQAAEAKRQLRRLDMQVQKRQHWRNKKRKRGREDDDDEELRELLKTLKQNVQGTDNNIQEMSNDEDLLLDYESGDEGHELDDEEESNMTRIYYCSRTHSQLNQFVQEVKRSLFGKDVRLVSLASRESLCINETVRGLRSISLINERCLDMQKNSGKKTCCPFKKEKAIDEFSQAVLSDVQDVEELANNGKLNKACPYYTARFAAQEAEIIVLPYNTLLHSGTRTATGLKLKDSVIIIDEAHNLMETISSVHTVMLEGQQISRANAQLSQYFSRYKGRLTAQNLLYVKQILFVLGAFLKYLVKDFGKEEKKDKAKETILCPLDFLSQVGIDNINLFKLLHYCDKSHISHKLHGFSSRNTVKAPTKMSVQSKLTSYLEKLDGAKSNNDENEDPQKEGSPFIAIQEFLRALTTANQDGRVICKQDADIIETSLKFLLLNPAAHFQGIVSEARAVVLAGGTMHPHSEFINKLLIPSGVTPQRICQFSCGHVVPKENLIALALSKGPSGKKDLDFTYGSRGNAELIEDAGRCILNLSVLVPGGMVVFFPSYEYEQFVFSCWERSGLLLRLSGRKRVFREPRKGSQVDALLSQYAKCISSPKSPQNGAILLSIVGGKMSEGINFSDDLGRCVVMLGLPFPNIHSVEFKEKKTYLETKLGSATANTYGQILCMRAVNQSIGRAIRHRADYAAIILMDVRYQQPSVQNGLPEWMRKSLHNCDNVGLALANVKNFFALHKGTKTSDT